MQFTRLISIVLPIFNEEGNIRLLYQKLVDVVAQRPDFEYEFVFVNDGSRDHSLEILAELTAADERVVVVDFARNFGHQVAVTAGLDHATGDAVVIMDADLQDPPELILQLLEKWEEGFDVAYAQRRTRQDTVFKKVTANLFYRVLEALADTPIPRNTGDFRVLDRRVVDQLNSMREHNRFLRGMVSFVGFKQVAVPFDRAERFAGESGYPLRKMIGFALDGILGFSTAPLKLISRVGYFFSALSFVGIIYALLMRFFAPEVTIEGWTFTVISILLIGGVQLITLGLLGSYIGRIYTEVQQRPLYITRRVIRAPALMKQRGE